MEPVQPDPPRDTDPLRDTDPVRHEVVYEAKVVSENPYAPTQQPATAAPPANVRERIDRSRGLMWLLVLGTTFGSVVLFLFMSLVATLGAIIFINDGAFPSAMNEETVAELMASRVGFVSSVMVPQFALLVLPVLATFLLPAGPRRSLRLVRGNWPMWGWIAAAAATPLIGTLTSMVMGPFIEESASLEAMSNAFRHHAQSGFLIPLLLIIGVTPSICEEILFRGFLQPRLTRLMPPSAGVFLASLAFAAMHVDPIHVLGVVPLGLWLGFLSYKSGSLFPAMLGHLVNNLLSVVSVLPEDSGVFDAPGTMMSIGIFGAGLLGLVGVVVLVIRNRYNVDERSLTAETGIADTEAR